MFLDRRKGNLLATIAFKQNSDSGGWQESMRLRGAKRLECYGSA